MSDKNVPAIRVSSLSKSFGDLEVLKDVSVEIQKGEIVSIIGESGCGKSVFLRLIEMLETPDEGQIFINGEEITAKNANIDLIRRNIGMVFQNFCLFTHMSVLENMIFAPVKLLKMNKEDARRKAIELLDMVGLASKADVMPSVLSGGQKQRVAIVRALMMEPKILLFDEPTSALDPTMVGEVLATIRMLSKRGLTMVIVTHEFRFVRDISTRVLYFAQKGIYDQGTPGEIFDNPQKELTVAFIRKIKYFSEQIRDAGFDLMELSGKIYLFGEKYGLSEKKNRVLQLCVEELIYEYIGSVYPDWKKGAAGIFPIEIDISVEYSELDEKLTLQLCSKGDAFDVFTSYDELDPEHLGVVIVKHSAAKYSWEYKDGKNHISIDILSHA